MFEREIIATIYRSDGNAEVGDMWTETKIFTDKQSIEHIFEWVDIRTQGKSDRTRIVLTVAQ